MTVYIVEDDTAIRQMESYALENAGIEVQAFACAEELYEACSKILPDLLVLDIMLPGEDGMRILSTLRRSRKTAHIPVMMVTAKGSEYDRVNGLDEGADDYMVKPFSVLEFISRVKALLRRCSPQVKSNRYTLGCILLDDVSRTIQIDGQDCFLTKKNTIC